MGLELFTKTSVLVEIVFSCRYAQSCWLAFL